MAERKTEIAKKGDADRHQNEGQGQGPVQEDVQEQKQRNRRAKQQTRMQPQKHFPFSPSGRLNQKLPRFRP